MSAGASATGGGSARSLLGRLFRRPSPIIPLQSDAPPSAAPSPLVARMGRARIPLLPPSRWTTIQVPIEGPDQGRHITDVLSQRYAVSKPTLLRFLRDGLITLLRAPKVSLPPESIDVPTADPASVRTIHPRENMRVEAGDLIYLTQVRLAPRPLALPIEKFGMQRASSSSSSPSRKLTPGEIEAIRSLTLYRDDRIIIINKPSGLAVHGGPGQQEHHLVAWLEALREPEDMHAPLPVHRLDRDTSGAMILARTRQAATELARRFRLNTQRLVPESQRTSGTRTRTRSVNGIEKIYWALAYGCPDRRHRRGRIVSAIYSRLRRESPSPSSREQECMTSWAHKRADLLDQGKTAITDYRWMQLHRTSRRQKREWKAQRFSHRDGLPFRRAMKLSLVELRPKTGRTHQLRVHMAEQLQMPIVGDYKYFPRQLPGHQMHLHCRRIILENWGGPGETLSVRAPLPDHWIQTMYSVPLHLRAPPPHPRKGRGSR